LSDSASMSIAVEKQRVHFRCLFVGVYVYQHRWSLLRIFLFAPPPDRNCGRIHCWERCRFLSSRVVPYIPPILVCLEPSINHLRRLNYFHTIRWFIDETHLRDSPAQKQTRRGSNFQCAAIRSFVVWRAKRNQQCNWLPKFYSRSMMP